MDVILRKKHLSDPDTPSDLWSNEHQVYLGFVVGPGAKLHGAVLVVKGEVGDVHGAGGFENSRRDPGDRAIKLQQSLGLVFHQEVTYSAARERFQGKMSFHLKAITTFNSKGQNMESMNKQQ